MTYYLFVPLLPDQIFTEIAEDILPHAVFEKFGVLSRIALTTEAEVVMFKLALPLGWQTSGVYQKQSEGSPTKINDGDGDAALYNNKRALDNWNNDVK